MTFALRFPILFTPQIDMTSKKLLHLISLLIFSASGVSAQAPVNSESKDVVFAVFDAQNELENRKLTDFENQLVVFFYFTPW